MTKQLRDFFQIFVSLSEYLFELYQTWNKVEEIWLNVKSEIFYNPLVKTHKIQFSMNICIQLWIRNAIKSYSEHFFDFKTHL